MRENSERSPAVASSRRGRWATAEATAESTAAGTARAPERVLVVPPVRVFPKAASRSVSVTFIPQSWRTDLSMPASESTRASSQTGHNVLEARRCTATCATTLPDRASDTEQSSVASPGPVRYDAPAVSRVGWRRRGATTAGSQRAAAVDVDGEVKTKMAAVTAADKKPLVDGVAAVALQTT